MEMVFIEITARRRRAACAAFVAFVCSIAAPPERAQAEPASFDPKLGREIYRERFDPLLARDVYRELVEIDTTESAGNTHRAAVAMAHRLLGAGFSEADVRVFETAPKRGNLVARLRGTGKKKPLLLLAHTDVVAAKPEDWSTDPFKLVEKDGYFYARGARRTTSTWRRALSST